jgi:putative hydrolase of the HAD superfamily
MAQRTDFVFDFGNVLVEWNPIHLVQAHFREHLQPTLSPEAFTARWMNEHWARYDLGHIDTPTVATLMAPTLACDREPLVKFIDHIPHVLPALPSSITALERLFAARDGGADIRVFYLSNMPREFADVLETRFDWIAHFNGGIFSGREGLAKPDPQIYATLQSRFSLSPERIVFLDDSVANLLAAQSHGWRTLHIGEESDVVRGVAKYVNLIE